uniref:WD repeat-containing protein 60 n=1 Tax=Knipowitschia caucasica TaxID=637954 RepID=A0AAV2L7J3_KNICA
MHTDKKKSKEDTWKPADLRRYIAEDGARGESRRHRGDSVDKYYKESRREVENYREEELKKQDVRRKEGSRDRRGDRERDRIREDRERDKDRSERGRGAANFTEKTDRRRDRDHTRDRERDKHRHSDKDKYTDEERLKMRQERDKEIRRHEREQGYNRESRGHVTVDKGGSESINKSNNERRERHREREKHKDEAEIGRSEKERRERHAERKHSERKERKEFQDEDRRKDKDDRERRHKEPRQHDEKQKHHGESREHRDQRKKEEENRRHHRDREAETERDKHRERRHKEEEDTEENMKERAQEKDKRSQQSNSSDTAKAGEAQMAADDYQEQEYEDDFEEYEDDFEDADESEDEDVQEQESVPKQELSAEKKEEIQAIQKAMDEENKRVGALSRQNPTETEEERPMESEKTESKTSQRGKFMDFVAAKQREVNKQVATKQKKRSTELLRLIDLDFTLTYSLLDLPPVNEYEMYIRNFGTANTKQAYVQCNEDNVERDIQTEEIELSEKWTQHPPENSGACGDPSISPKSQDASELNIDSKRLTTFLQSASQVMVMLLEEVQAGGRSLSKMKTQTEVLSFSDGSVQLNTNLPFLHGRCISLVHFSQVQKHTMISVHTSTTKPSSGPLDMHSLLCIWNIWEPSRPQRILMHESEVQCCCFSPGKATLVFAGTTVGSVVMWDLREHTSNNYRMDFGEDRWTFWHPSFSTDAAMSTSEYFSSVMAVEVVPSAAARDLRSEGSRLGTEDEATGLSFQLASLDECGILKFWVVVELPRADEAGSQTDSGLRPGSKVKLLHSSSLSVSDRMSHKLKTAPLQTLQLQFLPTDSNHFYIGTNMGIVHHGTTHGLKAHPRCYRCQEGEDRLFDINSISFSPFRHDLFLVGCGDGCVRLHAVKQEKPLLEWRDCCAGHSVVSVQWSQTRPAVFCVLDSNSNIYLWDLLRNEAEPVVTESQGKDRVTTVALFGDAGQQKTYSGVALAYESGKIDVQMMTRGEQRALHQSNTTSASGVIRTAQEEERGQQVDLDEDFDISFESDFKVKATSYIPPVVEELPPVEEPPPVPTPTIIPVVEEKKKKRKRKKKKAVTADEESEEEPAPLVPSAPVIPEKPVLKKKSVPEIPSLPPPLPLPTLPSSPAKKPASKPLPPLVPSPELPSFLQEFTNAEWFQQFFPDKTNIPSSPDSFYLLLLNFLCTCSAPIKPKILSVMETLHRQKQLQNEDQLYQKLLDTVPKMVSPNMSAGEQAVLGQLLNLLLSLKSVNQEFMKTLLTLTAYKELGLREKMLRVLKSLGVDEAEEWLWPQLETWESELHSKTNVWKSLHTSAHCLLNLWTAKYKDHTRDLFHSSAHKWKPSAFTAVDVVNHFCCVQKEGYLKAKQAAPSVNNSVILPRDCVSGPIYRLGETYCMTRRRKPKGFILPPLRDRPCLLHFPNYMSFPLPLIRLSLFNPDSEKYHLNFLNHRYYILEKSHVDYYR